MSLFRRIPANNRRLAIGPRQCLAVGLLAVWLGASAYFWNVLFAHAYRSAETQPAIAAWPADVALPSASGRFHVLIFAHPLCPCTRATFAELGESLARLKTKPALSVIFVTADLPSAQVARSDTLAVARRLPGARVETDQSGALARRFGATISGEAMVFGPHGRRLYRGGLTAGRGHEGDSAAQTLFEQILSSMSSGPVEAPVFGCRLPAVP